MKYLKYFKLYENLNSILNRISSESQDEDIFPKEISYFEHQSIIYGPSKKPQERFDVSEINLINSVKSYQKTRKDREFEIVLKKRRKESEKVTYRYYKFYITKLSDEYFLITCQFDKVQKDRKRWQTDAESHDTYYLLADGHIELKHFLTQVDRFSKSRQLLISIGILKSI